MAPTTFLPQGLPALIADLFGGGLCVICGSAGPVCCLSCRDAIAGGPPVRRTLDGAVHDSAVHAGLPVWSAGVYLGAPARLVVSFKDRDRPQLSTALAGLLAPGVTELTRNAAVAPEDCLLVPVPSALARTRRRGYRHTALLADRLARSTGARHRGLLRLNRGVDDQIGLATAQRRFNVAHAMSARSVPRRPRPTNASPVIVVDDVITTGATVAEAARALRTAGWAPIGAVTVAATRKRVSLPTERICG